MHVWKKWEQMHAHTSYPDSHVKDARVAMNNPEHKRFQFLWSEFLKYWEQRRTMKSQSDVCQPSFFNQHTVRHAVLWSQTHNLTHVVAAHDLVCANTCWGFSHSHTKMPPPSVPASLPPPLSCRHVCTQLLLMHLLQPVVFSSVRF